MRKLSNVFMMLSLLCFAVPGFAQGGEAAAGVQLHSSHSTAARVQGPRSK